MAEKEEKFDEELKEDESEEKEDKSEEGGGADGLEKGGIFDDDLELSEDESISDFSIGDTILSSAPSVHGRQGHNLEELAGRKKAEDSRWDDSSEFDREEDSSKDFYGTSGGNFYGENQNGNNLYQGESSNGDLYNSEKGGLHTGENSSGKKVYDPGESDVMSHGELVNSRRSGRSMLEVAGFEDKEKQKQRDMRGHVRYEGNIE